MKVALALNVEALEKAQGRKKLDDKELAAAMGLNQCTIYRVKTGRMKVGPGFIAGALQCFGLKAFQELFYLS